MSCQAQVPQAATAHVPERFLPKYRNSAQNQASEIHPTLCSPAEASFQTRDNCFRFCNMSNFPFLCSWQMLNTNHQAARTKHFHCLPLSLHPGQTAFSLPSPARQLYFPESIPHLPSFRLPRNAQMFLRYSNA